MEYYLAFKRKDILTHATTWMNPKDILLSKIHQSQKDKYSVIPLIWGTKAVRLTETESRMDSQCLMSTEYQFAKIKKCWTLISQHCEPI